MTRLALGLALVIALPSALAIALGLATVSPAGAQGPDVQIDEDKLDCNGDPELVVIENLGDAAQTLTGWELQSDPPDSEIFDLTVLGGLAPGASVSIQSGPSAGGVFKWGLEFIYRDDDPTDYARLVDDTGAIVHQVNCAEAAPTPSPTPSPSPEPSAPNGVPNGGGAPPIPGGSPSPAMILLIGGSVAVAGLALIAVPRLHLGPALAVAASSSQGVARGAQVIRREPHAPALGLTLVGLCAVAMFLILWRRA